MTKDYCFIMYNLADQDSGYFSAVNKTLVELHRNLKGDETFKRTFFPHFTDFYENELTKHAEKGFKAAHGM